MISGKDCALAFASCDHGEGASSVCLSLAASIGSVSSERVLLVDGDMRNPSLHLALDLKRGPGLAELVLDEAAADDAIIRLESMNIDFIPSGRAVEKPTMLFESAGFLKTVSKLKERYGFIIFDSSPVLRYPDACVMGARLDGLTLVLEAEKTNKEAAKLAQKILSSSNVRQLGAVLNKKRYFIPEKIYRLL